MKTSIDSQKNPFMDRYEFDDDDEATKFSDFYIPLEILGSGSFGTCVSARDIASKQIYAVKIIPKKKVEVTKETDLKSEAKILWQLNHPNIVKFINVIETDTKLLVVTELMKGGSLKKLMSERKASSKPFTDEEASTIMKNILSALYYMHNRGIVHRDLKPENILLQDASDLNSVKICDFGLSGQFDNVHQMYNVNTFAEFCGTRIYMAPEIFENKSYGKAVDIWSAGIILYMLLAQGQHPIYRPGDSSDKYEEKLLNPTWEFPPTFDKHSKHLFLHLVDKQPHNRYTAEQVLFHPWITRCFNKEPPKTLSESLGIYSNTQNLQRIMKLLYIMTKADFFNKEKREKRSPITRSDSNLLSRDLMSSKEASPMPQFRSGDSSENDPGVINRKLSILSEGEAPKPRIKGILLKKKSDQAIKFRPDSRLEQNPSTSSTTNLAKLKSTFNYTSQKPSQASTSTSTLNSLPDEAPETKRRPPKFLAKTGQFPSLPNLENAVVSDDVRLADRLPKCPPKLQATNPNTPRGGKSGNDTFKNLNNRKFKEIIMATDDTHSNRAEQRVPDAPKKPTPRKLRPVRDLSKNEKTGGKFQFNQEEFLFGPKSSGRGGNSTQVKSPVNRSTVSSNVQIFGKNV